MEKLWKITVYGYLVIAAVLFYKGFQDLSTDKNKAYMTIVLGALAIVVFFIKRNFRRRVVERNNKNKTR